MLAHFQPAEAHAVAQAQHGRLAAAVPHASAEGMPTGLAVSKGGPEARRRHVRFDRRRRSSLARTHGSAALHGSGAAAIFITGANARVAV
jgi:hypothetical protein